MKIIVSPAKKMQVLNDTIVPDKTPVFLEQTSGLMKMLQSFSKADLKTLFRANDKITHENYIRYQDMDLKRNLTPAALSYVGIQYQYMAPHIFSGSQWTYACDHLRILSGFYGILRADDGIVPYRLEMQALLEGSCFHNLYEFWGDTIYRELVKEDKFILNLASREYSKAVEPFLKEDVSFVSCIFGSLVDDKVKIKATQAKMARGEMVRWLSEKQIQTIEGVKNFTGLGYQFVPERSCEKKLVFVKGESK